MCRYTAVTEREGFEEIISERKRLPFAKANHFHCMLPLRGLALCLHPCCSIGDACCIHNVKHLTQNVL
jgi:hypothetical protein